MKFPKSVGLLVFLALSLGSVAIDQDANPGLVADLKLANTNLDWFDFLPDSSDWVYDHNTNPDFTFSPGGVSNGDVATFPAMLGRGLTVAFLNLGPCSMLPVHHHPRANNVVVAVSGNTTTYMIQENGAPVISTTLTAGMQTIFPQGSMHTMVNNDCTNSQLVASLSSDDPGTLNTGNNLFLLPQELVQRLLSGISDYSNTAANIPPIGTGSNTGYGSCLQRCGLNGTGSNNTSGYNVIKI